MILVVDDSMIMRRIIKNTLMHTGNIRQEEIIEAEDGLDALEKYKQYKDKIDVILTDWNMPNMTGFELLKKIREEDKNVRIIMITTEGGKKEVIEALKAGANNYIVKPFTPQVLREKLMAIGVI